MSGMIGSAGMVDVPRGKASWARRAILLVLAVLAILPAAGPLGLIHRYGVNFPYWDAWALITAPLDVHDGVFPRTAFDQHNEHRVVVPELIYCGLDNATHWDQFAAMYATFGIVCLTSLGIYLLLRSTIPANPDREFTIVGVWFVCNVLMFFIGQQQNWLWEVGMMNVTPMLFIVWTIVVFRGRFRAWLRMAMCLVLATAATFSSGNGMLVWPLVGLLWCWSPSWAALVAKKRLLIAWLTGFAINMGLYFFHYATPDHLKPGYTWDPLVSGRYSLAFLGNSFAFGLQATPVMQATLAGVVVVTLLIACVLACCFRRSFWKDFEFSSRVMVWITVAGFSVGSAVMAAHGRGGSGLVLALESRYVTFSLYLPMSLICLTVLTTSSPTGRQIRGGIIVTTAVATGYMLLQIIAIPAALVNASTMRNERIQGKAGLLLVNSLQDDDPIFNLIFNEPWKLRAVAARANALGYIHPALVATNHAREIQDTNDRNRAIGSFDKLEAVDSHTLFAGGWAGLPAQGKSPDAIFLTWDRMNDDPMIFAIADANQPRQDVAEAMKEPGYANSGWSLRCPLTRLPAGIDPLRIRVWAFDVETARAVQIPGETILHR